MVRRKKPEGQVTAIGYRRQPDGSIAFDGDVPAEERLEILEEEAKRLKEEGIRRELWGEVGPGAMTRLARMFPLLRMAEGIEPWDATQLLKWLCSSPAVTSGSFYAALFVLGVWNSGVDWGEAAKELPLRRCDICKGLGRIDEEGGEAVQLGPEPETYVRSKYGERDEYLGDVQVATRKCLGCDGRGKVIPTLNRGRFDVFRAMSVWDLEHRSAFETWIKHPFWP
jgi:hypothetical protein